MPARRLRKAALEHGDLLPKRLRPIDEHPSNKRAAPGPPDPARLYAVADGYLEAAQVACPGVSLAQRLAARTLELVDVASESRAEAARRPRARRAARRRRRRPRPGDTCVLAGDAPRERPLVLLAGHLDTVPAQGNRPGRRDGGRRTASARRHEGRRWR